MPESAALQELQNLVNQSNQEFEALKQSWSENHEIDTFITTQCLRTLHTAKGLSKMCGLPKAATIIHTLETIVNNLAKGELTVDGHVLATLANANTLIFSIVTHGEEQMGVTIDQMIKTLEAFDHTIETNSSASCHPELVSGSIPYKVERSTSVSSPLHPLKDIQSDHSPLDYQTLGLQDEDIKQLAQTEKLMLEQTYKKNRPLVSYLVHFDLENLEKSTIELCKKINESGTMITMIPTHAKDQKYQYAFIFLFTTALDKEKLAETLTSPGVLTWVQRDHDHAKISLGAGIENSPKAFPLANPLEEKILPTTPKPARKIISTKIDFDAIEEKIWNQKNDPILHVPLSKIDQLISEANRLISCKIKLEKLSKKLHSAEDPLEVLVSIDSNISSLDKHTKLLQQGILNARLDKAETIEADLRRLVTSLAQEHGKKIDFILEGRNILLDKSLLDGLQNPLLHLIKNSADHGIKTPEERKLAGKPETGTIRLTFTTNGDKTTISLEDDGQGLALSDIRKKAVEKGLIDPVKAATLTPQELYQFIFIPGFSTKKELTQTSGRGIGMNAVKDAIEKMHGQLYFESQENIGTKFTITIPSYLSIQRLLHFLVCEQHYALPFSAIAEVIPYEKEHLQKANNQQLILWQGKPVKLFDLSTVFGLKNRVGSHEPTVNNLIIMRHDKHHIALHVHDILGQEEIIIRPLDFGENKAFELFEGHADFGDDALVLIINSDKIWEILNRE